LAKWHREIEGSGGRGLANLRSGASPLAGRQGQLSNCVGRDCRRKRTRQEAARYTESPEESRSSRSRLISFVGRTPSPPLTPRQSQCRTARRRQGPVRPSMVTDADAVAVSGCAVTTNEPLPRQVVVQVVTA